MCEAEQRHRMANETALVNAAITRSKLGMIFGFGVVLVCMATALWLGLAGKEASASIIGGISLVSLVSVFVYGKHKEDAASKQPEE
mgnify:CR=1 FL=1